jgi:prepilin-type N-terminal cleavage/methylation domain-containing protein
MIRNGYTIMELLVAVAISTIGLAAIYTVVFQGYGYLSRADGSAVNLGTIADRGRIRLGVERMISELRESSLSTVELSDSGDGIGFASPRGSDGSFNLNPDGSPRWVKAVVYFLDGGRLYRYEEPKTDWSQNFDPDLVFQGGRDSQWQEIAGSVEELSFQISDDMISIHIRATDGLSLDTSVRVRN